MIQAGALTAEIYMLQLLPVGASITWHAFLNLSLKQTMRLLYSLLGGLAGAAALNIIHETVRHLNQEAPKIELVGEEAVNKVRKLAGAEPLKGKRLYAAALTGDIVTNALYYSIAGISPKNAITIGTLTGAAAGVGALCLTKPMGLDDAPVNRSRKAQIGTVAYYTLGGLVAGLVIRQLSKN